MFEGFRHDRITVDGTEIAFATAGTGPAVLLLHGYPQNRFMWTKVAPLLSDRFTVVCSDLRGYGDSAKPPNAPDNSTYSFRAMARDQVLLMAALGHTQFHVAGHDRGGRVAHRMALDWRGRLLAVAVLDLVPTVIMYEKMDRQIATTYWQWSFLPQPAPYPEHLIGADPDYYFEHCLGTNGGTSIAAFDEDMLAEYRRCWRDPEMIHASCNDYRAGNTIDLDHDRSDIDSKVDCPMLALWAADGIMTKLFDIGAEWGARALNLTTATVPGGHFFLDQQPLASADRLASFFAAAAVSAEAH